MPKKGEKWKPANWKSKPSIFIGDKFMLKCGVEVTVKEYISSHKILVTDGIYERYVNGTSLRRGGVKWKIDGKIRFREKRTYKYEEYGLPKKYKVGKIFKNKYNKEFEILEIDDENIYIKFLETGAEKSYPANRHFRPKECLDTSQIVSIKIGDKFALKCGVSVEVIEYTSYYDIIVSDGILSRKVDGYALKAGTCKWEINGVMRTRPVLYEPKRKNRKLEPLAVGEIHESNNYGKFCISVIKSASKVGIIWENTKTFQLVTADSIRNGSVSDKGIAGNFLKPKGHYVYFAACEGEIVYIGRGQGARYNHCLHGTSSSYLLNRLHFEGKHVVVGIHRDNLSQQESINLEEYLLNIFRPRGNVIIPNVPEDIENKVSHLI